MRQLNLTITPGITDLWVKIYDDAKRDVPVAAVLKDRWVLQFDNGDASSGGLNVRINAPGYREWVGRFTMPPDNVQKEADTPVEMQAGSGPFPQAPTRDQACSVCITFQGLTVSLPGLGDLPWFEPGYQCLGVDDRKAVRAAKHAAGDTHLILEFFRDAGSIYDEPGQPYQQFISPSMEQNPAYFLSLVEEVRADGFIPLIVFDGDAGDDPDHGYPNALRQLPILVDLLKSSTHDDLNAHVLYGRLWDGVFYGSTPENIAAFGTAFRALLPDGYLAIEHQPGRIPAGEGGGDYQPGGRLSTYDVVMSEFNWPVNDDATWQVVGRLVSPYNRPSDQPSGDDPSPPFYFAPGSPRGPYYYCAFEFAAYQWVRSQVTAADIDVQRSYLKGLGCDYTG